MTITDAMQPIEPVDEDTFYVKLAEATQKIIDDARAKQIVRPMSVAEADEKRVTVESYAATLREEADAILASRGITASLVDAVNRSAA